MKMTVSEFYEAMQRGEVSAATLFGHFKAGDFTAEEYNAYCNGRAGAPLQEMVDSFYAGDLFKAQYCNFVDWCDGRDLFQDRSTARKFTDLVASTGQKLPEIEGYITLIINPKRMLHKVLSEDEKALKKVLDEYNRRIDSNGWRSWPKQKGN